MQLNKVYHSSFLENTLPDKSVQLLIADPPYFEVKGGFDFVWSSFDEYLKDVEKWAQECKRLLADNGTLFWWGHAKKIAYSQIILDRYFNLVCCPVWNKGNFLGLDKSEGLRSFAPCTERLLMYSSKNQDLTGLQFVEKEYIAPLNPFAKELKKARIKSNLTINQVAELGKFYGKVNHGGSVTNWEKGYNVPSKKQWEVLCKKLPIKRQEYEQLRQEYEQLRQEYEQLRRPFNNQYKLNEILNFSNEAQKTGSKYKHPTKKPEKLTRALILTCSRPDDLVFVPFAGSGTECAMSAKEGRKFIGFDIEKKYVDMSNKRAAIHLNQTKLF
jgi:site-specific DNA-methyltransferase (adenine-specific)